MKSKKTFVFLATITIILGMLCSCQTLNRKMIALTTGQEYVKAKDPKAGIEIIPGSNEDPFKNSEWEGLGITLLQFKENGEALNGANSCTYIVRKMNNSYTAFIKFKGLMKLNTSVQVSLTIDSFDATEGECDSNGALVKCTKITKN